MATFLDDYSKLSYVKPVPTKDIVPDIVKIVINQWEKQVGNPVKTVRSDRGGEYVNSRLKDFFTTKGIVHQTTAPYTPEQNGAAERLNRTLMERVRAMLRYAQVPAYLWGEAIGAANYVRNCSPVTNQSKTPVELFTGIKPDVSKFRTFGSTAYVHIPKALRNKLDAVSVKGIFVGYEETSKAYRILLDNESKILISRNVIFDETTGSRGDNSVDNKDLVNNSLERDDITDTEDNTAQDVPADQHDEDNQPVPDEQPLHQDTASEGASEPVQVPVRRYPLRERRPPSEWYRATVAKFFFFLTEGLTEGERKGKWKRWRQQKKSWRTCIRLVAQKSFTMSIHLDQGPNQLGTCKPTAMRPADACPLACPQNDLNKHIFSRYGCWILQLMLIT